MITVWTDGGATGSKHPLAPHLASWAFLIVMPTGQRISSSGWFEGGTNNHAEMTAVIKALEQLRRMRIGGYPVLLISDSQYVINGATVYWKGWVQNGWLTYDKKPVANKGYWKRLLHAQHFINLTYRWVKGHKGVYGNEAVDKLCTEARHDYYRMHGIPLPKPKQRKPSQHEA